MVEILDGADWLGVPSIVLGELHAGFRLGSHRRRNEAELQAFLAHRVVEELPVDHDVARIYAELLAAMRAKGAPIPTNDLWIAATAVDAGAPLVAFDAHFAAIERVGSIVLEPSDDPPASTR